MISSRTYLTLTPSVLTVCFITFNTIFFISSSLVVNSRMSVGFKSSVKSPACLESIKGMIKPIALRNAASAFPRYIDTPSIRGTNTDSKASIPYGLLASARALRASAVIVLTFYSSSLMPCSIDSTKFLRCGRTAQPIRIAVY